MKSRWISHIQFLQKCEKRRSGNAPLMNFWNESIFVVRARREGLPDGIFSNQKSQFGKIFEGLAMENVGAFYDHLVHVTAIWYMLVHFFTFWWQEGGGDHCYCPREFFLKGRSRRLSELFRPIHSNPGLPDFSW
jgi:hypothetical protein